MLLLSLRLMVDFGLVVLIWMTQLIVYPSFSQFEEERLKGWHGRYNQMITLIVAPLMFAQLGIAIWQLWLSPEFYPISSLILVLIAWLLTFLQAVPLHGKIATGESVMLAAAKLVKVNWWRTLVWTVIFLLSLNELLG